MAFLVPASVLAIPGVTVGYLVGRDFTDTVIDVDTALSDLWFDANSVAGDMVAECWISHGPRADDADFDPAPGDCSPWETATRHRSEPE